MKVIFCLKKRYSWKIAAKIVTVAPKYRLFTDATTMYCNHYSISFFLFFHSCHELIIFCHILYTKYHISLIIKEESHLSLTMGNKIATKNEEIRLVVDFMCKGNKRQLPAKKETRLLPYNSFFKSSTSGRALRSRSGISLDAR